jgi:hypothetical protein
MAIADLTAVGCQVETAAASRSGLGGFVALHVAAGVAAGVKHLTLNRKRVPDSRVLADAGRAGEGHRAASGATRVRRARRKRKIAGAVSLL